MINKLVSLSIIAFLSLGSVSCVKKEALKPSPQMPAAEALPVTVETLKKSLIFNKLKPVKSEVSIEVLKKGETAPRIFEGLFVYAPPDSVNIRIFGPLGLTAVEMVLSKKSLLQVFVPFKNTIYEGVMNEAIFRVPGEGSPVLYGMKKTDEGYMLYAFRKTGLPDKEEIEMLGQYAFSSPELQNTGILIYRGGKRFMDIAFNDFSGNDKKVPFSIGVSLPDGLIMKIRLIEPEITNDVSNDYFQKIDHEGKEVRPLKDLFGKSP